MMRSPAGRPPKNPSSGSKPLLTAQSSPYQKFNYNLDRLLELLAQIYPEDQDLIFYREKLDSVIHINFKLPCDLFIKVVAEYIPPIMKGDDQYFLNLKYDELVENPKYLAIIQKVMDLWTMSTEKELKKTINNYLKLLVCYGIKATKRHDLLQIVNQYREKPLEL